MDEVAQEELARISRIADDRLIGLRQARILIVDDEVALLSAYRRLFKPSHTLETAESGARAIQILHLRSDFDLIVCDLMMPEMDGPAFFNFVQRKWPHLAQRTVFSSGAGMSERARSFVGSINIQCMTKPIRLTEIERILTTMEAHRCLLMNA